MIDSIPFISKELKYSVEYKYDYPNIDAHKELVENAKKGINQKKELEVEQILVRYVDTYFKSWKDAVKHINHKLYPNGYEEYIDESRDGKVILTVSVPQFVWKESKETFSTYLDARVYVTEGN